MALINPQNNQQRVLIETRALQAAVTNPAASPALTTVLVRGLGCIQLLLDALNALNDTAAESIASDELFTTFGQAATFVDPRRAMVGVRGERRPVTVGRRASGSSAPSPLCGLGRLIG